VFFPVVYCHRVSSVKRGRRQIPPAALFLLDAAGGGNPSGNG
jgi:hypothetical protein